MSIEELTAAIISELGDSWIPSIYREKVRSQRTRSYEFEVPERENPADILFTLLGIELKVGKRRFACPDLATARYLSVFARVGCPAVAIPYDITKISLLADEIEVAWQKMLLLVDNSGRELSAQARGRMRASLLRAVRTEIARMGPGERMPEFRNSTRQRDY